MSMTSDEQRAYATKLIVAHTQDIEYMSIFEMAEQYAGREIVDVDAHAVDDLISNATVTVSWEAS